MSIEAELVKWIREAKKISYVVKVQANFRPSSLIRTSPRCVTELAAEIQIFSEGIDSDTFDFVSEDGNMVCRCNRIRVESKKRRIKP